MPKKPELGGIQSAIDRQLQEKKVVAAKATQLAKDNEKDFSDRSKRVYDFIGRYIKELRRNPDYRSKSHDGGVNIQLGEPPHWKNLPEILQQYLLPQAPTDVYSVSAYEDENGNHLHLRIGTLSHIERSVDVRAVSGWTRSSVNVQLSFLGLVNQAPKPSLEAYHKINGLFEKPDVLKTAIDFAEGITQFVQKETVRTLQAKR